MTSTEGDQFISVVNIYNYLGIYVSSRLFLSHILIGQWKLSWHFILNCLMNRWLSLVYWHTPIAIFLSSLYVCGVMFIYNLSHGSHLFTGNLMAFTCLLTCSYRHIFVLHLTPCDVMEYGWSVQAVCRGSHFVSTLLSTNGQETCRWLLQVTDNRSREQVSGQSLSSEKPALRNRHLPHLVVHAVSK